MRRIPHLGLLAAVVLGIGAMQLLRTCAPIGRDVGNSAIADAARVDAGAPQERYGAADLVMVVYTDYQCPACRDAEPAMRQALREDGNMRVIYKDWPIFGERSDRAAEVALAAQYQGRYSAVHRQLMRAPLPIGEASLRAAVTRAGGDWNRITADLADHGPEIRQRLSANAHEAFALGLKGTPSFLIGPVLIEGKISAADFARAFRQARSMQRRE